MLFILLGIFVVSLFIFMAVAFFLPEWVGITGKKAKEVMEHQAGVPNSDAEVPLHEVKGTPPGQKG